MKKLGKIIALAAACVTAAAMAVGLAACGGSSSANMTGYYVSDDTLSWFNALTSMGYNYYAADITSQQLETYDDNTYVFRVNTVTLSAINIGPTVDTGDETYNDHGQAVTVYYGTYTISESDSDSMTILLNTPTRVVMVGSYDSDTVTDDDVIVSDYTAYGGEYTETKVSDYLAGIMESFGTQEIFVDLTQCTFDQIDI